MNNQYGLDADYFIRLCAREFNPDVIRNQNPEDLARAFARAARTACAEVLAEAEFAAPAAVGADLSRLIAEKQAEAIKALAESFRENWPEHMGKYDFIVGYGLRIRHTATPAAEQPKCMACSGHGLVGGFVSAESGYDAEDCPDCHAEQPDAVKVPRELLKRHLDEVGEYAWETYDEMRALLGKDGEE